jgi:hypothetical protein
VIAVAAGRAELAPKYSLAQVLLELDRADEAVSTAREILEVWPVSSIGDQARILICQERTGHSPTEARQPKSASSDYTPEEIIFKVATVVPAQAPLTAGVVDLRVQIDEEGCTTAVEVVQGLTESLTESAVAATWKSIFRPATRDGVPIAVSRETEVRFEAQQLNP